MRNLKLALCVSLACALSVRAEIKELAYEDVRLKGPYGEILERMIDRQIKGADPTYITKVFRNKTERNWKWSTEFWGKYMHSAVPYWRMTGDAGLREKIDAGVAAVIASQEPGGYIGNYPSEKRCSGGWDVWGMKYTLLGLLYHYEGTRDARSLEAARRLCDFMIANLGPGSAHPIADTGCFAGMPSCSGLEGVVWLYSLTKEKRYLDFAAFIVSEMERRAGLLSQKDVPVWNRDGGEQRNGITSRLKAYEMLSCYQGLIDYAEATGDERCLAAARATGESVLADEVNLAGGASCDERWFRGAVHQHQVYSTLQETCVTTTWMRFCERLWVATADPKWLDALERTFYNAYLAALKPDGSMFASYTPLNGSRFRGHEQCWMHMACCNANGPRGYLAVLRSLMGTEKDTVYLNFYLSGSVRAKVPATGRMAEFDIYTHYPLRNTIRIEYRSPEAADFTLALRIPAWSVGTDVVVNGKTVEAVKPGGYLRLKRTWEPGDEVKVNLDMTVRKHLLDHCIAFTCGPVALVRDSRFADGDVGEGLCRAVGEDGWWPNFRPVRRPEPSLRMVFSCELPVVPHMHVEFPEDDFPQQVSFCDYASGANSWSPSHWCRLWLPIERSIGD